MMESTPCSCNHRDTPLHVSGMNPLVHAVCTCKIGRNPAGWCDINTAANLPSCVSLPHHLLPVTGWETLEHFAFRSERQRADRKGHIPQVR